MFKSIKIRTKLILGSISIVLLIGTVGFFGLNGSRQINVAFSAITQEIQRDIDAASEASSFAKRAEGHLMLYLALRDEIDREKFFLRHDSLEEQIALLKTIKTEDPEVIDQIALLNSSSDKILQFGNQILQLYDADPEQFDALKYPEQIRNFHDASSAARKAGVEIVALQTMKTNNIIADAREEVTDIQRTIVVVMIIVLVVAVGIGVLITVTLSKSISDARNVAVEIARGNMDVPIDTSGKDEIAELNQAIDKMRQSLKVVMEEYERKLR